ncbi:MAG: TorF family putative porin, partial [Hyphomonadaceae bacterium]
EGLTLGLGLYYSPEFTGEIGDGFYYEANAAYTINDMFSISGGLGNQNVDIDSYFGPGEDSYTTWNIGGTLTAYGFGVDLRYSDTDIDPEFVGPSGDEVSDGRVVLTLKRAL